MRRRNIVILLVFLLLMLFYYKIEYERYFISNREKTEYITIWLSSNNDCYIVPGKYFSPLTPKTNYIKTVNHRNYIGVIWKTQDSIKYKISIYNEYQIHDLDPRIKVYDNNMTLLEEYKVLKTSSTGRIIKNDSTDIRRKLLNYEYIDLNRVWGIKTFSW